MSRSRLAILLSVVWCAVVLAAFHFGPEGFPPDGPAMLLMNVSLLALIVAAAWGLGAFLLGPLRLADESPEEAPLFEVGAGLGGIALAVFMVSALGLLYRWVVLVILGLGVALLGRIRRGGRLDPARADRRWTGVEIALLAMSALAGLMTLVCSFAPPQFYDALIYHLAVPDVYIRQHGMTPLPGNFYSNYPANMGMLYAVALSVRGGELAKAVHWLCGALAACALTLSAKRHTDRTTAVIACTLFAVTPGVMLVSTYSIADLGVTLFGMLCFAAVLNLWASGRRRWTIVAGIFAGLALGTKYTAALVVFAPAAAAIASRPAAPVPAKHARRAAFMDLTLYAGIAFLVMSPWLVRNVVYAGNPVAPYFSIQGAPAGDSTPGVAEEIARRLPRDAGPASIAWHYVSAPWSVTMGTLGAGGYLGAAFLILIPSLFLSKGLPRIVAPVGLMAGVAFAGWALTTQVTRYLFPALPLLAMLAAVAALRLPRAITVPALGWSLLYNLFLFLFLAETIGNLHVVTGAETRHEFLSRRVSYYEAASFLEGSTPADARVLFVGEGRGFYCPRDYAASTPFDTPIIDRYAAQSNDEQDLIDRLRADRFTHLLVSDPELRRTRGMGADDVMRRYFPSGAPMLMFEKYGVRVYSLPG